MRPVRTVSTERGVALVVAMLFLLVVTIISVVAARDSSFSMQMSGNLQDQANSLQSAEAGIFGALALANTGNDPFDGDSVDDPFNGVSPSPLDSINDLGSVDADVTRVRFAAGCPAAETSDVMFSVGNTECDYYRVDSEHDVPKRARTQVSLGVVRTIPVGN